MDNSLEKPLVENATPRHRSSRPTILVIAVLLVAGIAAFIFALNRHQSDKASSTSEPTTQTEGNTDSPEKEKEPEEKQTEPSEPEKEPEEEPEEITQNKAPVKQEGEDPNTLSELTGVINYAAVNDDTLMIRVSIDQYLSSGTCFLELTAQNIDDSFSLSDNIAQSASTSSCTYDIATSLLTGGKYDIKITLNSENKKGIIKGEVDV